MEYEWVIYEKEDGIAILTLNRQDRLNSWIPPMRVEARKCIEDAGADSAVRVLIVTGAGRGFCAGADVGTVVAGTEEADDEPPRQRLMLPVSTVRLMDALHSLNKPTIAAINGITAGSGIGFALACDVIIASEQARFRIAFTRIGVVPGDGITWLMTRAIGTHRALELAYTNDIIDAKEMERVGLANRVVPHDELMKAAKEMAKKMMQIPPLTLAMTKKAIYHSLGASSLEDQIVFEHAAGSAIRGTQDSKEASSSFMEKRPPVYKGK
ncbi:MAG: enoyl-CoA hydratase/isomerase family protein [Chloroflexi bacterium]|nr:enoyl-CoA hydratase/isomerase family protein [Chloroflexota bacterium]